MPGNRLLEPDALGTGFGKVRRGFLEAVLGTRHWKRIVLPGCLVLPGFATGFVNQALGDTS